MGPWQRLPGRSETVPLWRSLPCSCTHLAALQERFAVGLTFSGNLACRCGNSNWGHGSACLGDQKLCISGVHCPPYAHSGLQKRHQGAQRIQFSLVTNLFASLLAAMLYMP